eukprot:scaffold15753_cov58-Phaeocystis_antarctica.AAC.4
MPRLLMEASVPGCRLPSVSRVVSSASRHSGSAAAWSPLASERFLVPIAERRAPHLQHLAIQRLSLVELALVLQLLREPIQGESRAPAIRALDLEPRTQEQDAQRVAVLVLALAAAVGCILLWARAPPVLEAVVVGPHGGAAAGARLHERAVAFALQAYPTLPLVLAGTLALGARALRHVGTYRADVKRRAGEG